MFWRNSGDGSWQLVHQPDLAWIDLAFGRPRVLVLEKWSAGMHQQNVQPSRAATKHEDAGGSLGHVKPTALILAVQTGQMMREMTRLRLRPYESAARTPPA